MDPLTPRQREIYDFLKQRIAGGLPPTVREIGDEVGINSPNGVACHLKALVKKGYITRESMSSRSIRLTEKPVCPHCGESLETESTNGTV